MAVFVLVIPRLNHLSALCSSTAWKSKPSGRSDTNAAWSDASLFSDGYALVCDIDRVSDVQWCESTDLWRDLHARWFSDKLNVRGNTTRSSTLKSSDYHKLLRPLLLFPSLWDPSSRSWSLQTLFWSEELTDFSIWWEFRHASAIWARSL